MKPGNPKKVGALKAPSRKFNKRLGKNPGDPARALPFGASCAASCQRVADCRKIHAILGSEGVCVHTPSQYLPNVATVADIDTMVGLSRGDLE